MNGWFLALIILHVLGLGVTMAQHGKPKEGKYSFFGQLFGSAVVLTLVYMAIKSGF